jgi:hypothetical protein
MANKPLKPKEVTELLSKLKSTTPDYPVDLMAARKAAFVKKAIATKLEGKGPGGQHGGSGGSGTTAGGTTAGQGFFWQAAIGLLVAAALLVAGYIYREPIINLLDGDGTSLVESPMPSSTEVSTLTPVAITPTPSAFATPTLTDIVTTDTPTAVTLKPGVIIIISGTPYIVDPFGTPVVAGTPEGTKDNPGLHLGETPGTPAAPGQGNPGNTNQPPKPTKPPKSTKPPKPTKPPKK